MICDVAHGLPKRPEKAQTFNIQCIYILNVSERETAMVEKHKRKKAGKKDSQLVIRISGEERDKFITLCEELDTSAAREIRKFIRTFVEQQAT